MRTARQQHIGIGTSLFEVNAAQPAREEHPAAQTVRNEKPEVQTDLIVTAAAGVEFFPYFTHNFRQAGFDVHMHIFQLLPPGKSPRLNFSTYLIQA